MKSAEIDIVAANAEIDRQREVIRSLNARCDHLGIRLGEVIRERDKLRAAIERACAAYPADRTVEPTCVTILRDAVRLNAELWRA